MSESGKKRLFVAVGLPQEIRTALQQLQSDLKKFARDAKWVKPEGIHLTLKFLGYVEPERVDTIVESLRAVANTCAPTQVEVKGCGAFPNTRRPNVLWVGADSTDLLRIQERVENAMELLEFAKENRAFSPHLTLARFRDPHGLAPLMLEIAKKKESVFGQFRANNFKLYESILHREGAEYHVVQEFPLEGTQWM